MPKKTRPRGPGARPRKGTVFKSVEETPMKYSGNLYPVNLQEQKERFMKYGITPKFILKESSETLEKIRNKKKAQIKFDLLPLAKDILESVKKKYGDGASFVEQNYGAKINQEEATEILDEYLKENNLEGEITIYWTSDLTCSARMMWHGPSTKYNKPEARKYTLIILNTSGNSYLREKGIRCLADHEIGTHFFRYVNDGLQPWFSDRQKFGLRSTKSRESTVSEEGFAAINTSLNSNSKFLWYPALLYYTACMATDMTFRELYDHLETYVFDADQRWKHVMRVKRSLNDPGDCGGYGNDQCYFEGAVDVLRNMDKIDFNLFYTGKLCVDEVNRVRRLARTDCIKLPRFLLDVEKYKRTLRQIAITNGIIEKPQPKKSIPQPKTSRKRQKPLRNSLGSSFSPHPPLNKNKRNYPSRASTQTLSSPTSDTNEESECSASPQPSVTKKDAHDFIYPRTPLLHARRDKDKECVSVEEAPWGKVASSRMLIRPQSTPNRVNKPDGTRFPRGSSGLQTWDSQMKPRVEWFGLLERKMEY